ncbi:MAG: hypothetical protein ACXWNG_05055 [Candidatus Limnocylindrales bacterium]
MRFQDAAPDARAIVYQGIQADPSVGRVAGLLADASLALRVMARAVMNGERTAPEGWRRMFPTLLGEAATGSLRDQAEALLAACLEVADRGEQARSQYRGAIVEELTARLLGRRVAAVRRERRVLFDGVPADIHPYDVTVETSGAEEVYDCKWGARGINADVLHQLDDAGRHAAEEERAVRVGIVVFDARASCEVRLAGLTAPHERTALIPLEGLGRLARARP